MGDSGDDDSANVLRNIFGLEPVNSELRLAVLNFLRIFSLNCS